jgi:hypothetical protein
MIAGIATYHSPACAPVGELLDPGTISALKFAGSVLVLGLVFAAWKIWRWRARRALLRPHEPQVVARPRDASDALYARIKGGIGKLERLRIRVVLRLALFVAIGVPVLATIHWLLGDRIPDETHIWIGLAGTIAIGGGGLWNYQDYRRLFKQRVIAAFVRAMGLSYAPKACIARSTFVESGLFRGHRIDAYRGEDLVSGRIGETELRFSELTVEETQENQQGKNRSFEIFGGTFFVADFNKHFAGTTYVFDAAPNTRRQYGERVELEHAAFEAVFDVHASDALEARYILSSALMQRLLEFRLSHSYPMRIGFAGSRVYIAFMGMKLFEPRLFRTLEDPAYYGEIQDDLELLTGIVEDLNLNTRIWTKS